MKKLLGLFTFLMIFPNCANAYFDVCNADVLQDVRAIENRSNVLRKGSKYEGISVYNEDRKTRNGYFCSHGGYCYPNRVIVNGMKVEALKLNNCQISASSSGDKEKTSYNLTPIASKIPKKVLSIYNVDQKLLQMGMSTAGSSVAREAYFNKPHSACARLVRRALSGDQSAIAKLTDGDTICN